MWEDKIKIDLTKVIYIRGGESEAIVAIDHQKLDTDINGDLISNSWREEKKATMGRMIEDSLLHNPKYGEIKEEDVIKRYKLFKSIENKDSAELSIEDVHFIAECLINKYPIFFVGQILENIYNN